MLTDTHAHLYWDSFQPDLDQVINRAVLSNVKTIINIGVDILTSQQAIDQSKKFLDIRSLATVGVHPHESNKYNDAGSLQQCINELSHISRRNKDQVIAIGECGLDYYHHNTGKIIDNQLSLYHSQVQLAKELNLPVIIHCRQAWQDVFIDELTGVTGLFHNFAGSEDDAKKALELGFYLSFSCILTYPKNEHLRQIVKSIPLDKILTETDCPFLPPQSIRGQRNEPANITEVVKVIAEVKNLGYQTVAEETYQNTHRLFKLADWPKHLYNDRAR